MTQLPKEIDGYPILSLIGEGAFSKIYAAKDPKTRQLLALKHVIINDPKKDERWVEQMESETRIANALDHPVLRKVLHFKRQRRWLKSLGAVMLMEFVDGRIFLDNSLPGLSPAERTQAYDELINTLAKLQKLDPVKIGLGSYGKIGPDYFER